MCYCLQGYLLLLWDTPVGLLGCTYLLLLVLLLLLPPTAAALQHQRRQQQRRQQHVSLPDEEVQQPLLDSHGEVQDTAATPAGPADIQGSTSAASWRWLLPLSLAVLCVADLAAQYVLVVGALVEDRPLLPSNVSAWIRDVVGIDDGASGVLLLASLMRPAVMLTGLAIHRQVLGSGQGGGPVRLAITISCDALTNMHTINASPSQVLEAKSCISALCQLARHCTFSPRGQGIISVLE